MQIAILGRQAGLSLAELEAVYSPAAASVTSKGVPVRAIGSYAALVDAKQPIAQARLGGTVKSGTVLVRLEKSGLDGAFVYLKNNVKEFASNLPDGKLKLGFSIYGFDVKPQQLTRKTLGYKKLLKNLGRSVRVIENKTIELSSAQVLYNKLTRDLGCEFLIIKDSTSVIIAQTTGIQDIDDYSTRDFARPKRDARVGMLPPKLAQIMINLASLSDATDKSKNSPRILDPFCGTGVVLQEAALMDFDVYGSDLEKRMIDYTRDNLVWLEDKYQIQFDKYFEVADATDHTWQRPIDAVICEAYLGRAFSVEPTQEALEEARNTCNLIIRKFLQNLVLQLETGTPVVVAAPVWFIRNQTHHLKMLDDLENLGYNQVSFECANPSDLVYHRVDQIVGRQLMVLTVI